VSWWKVHRGTLLLEDLRRVRLRNWNDFARAAFVAYVWCPGLQHSILLLLPEYHSDHLRVLRLPGSNDFARAV